MLRYTHILPLVQDNISLSWGNIFSIYIAVYKSLKPHIKLYAMIFLASKVRRAFVNSTNQPRIIPFYCGSCTSSTLTLDTYHCKGDQVCGTAGLRTGVVLALWHPQVSQPTCQWLPHSPAAQCFAQEHCLRFPGTFTVHVKHFGSNMPSCITVVYYCCILFLFYGILCLTVICLAPWSLIN